MKIAVHIIRIVVGVLFIISGLVKANDPLGLSYKMQEFFEVWNADLSASGFFLKSALVNTFHFFHEHSLALSVFMIALEIMAGIALLIGWQKKFVLSLLSILIIFFTFLTGYAYASGKFKNCGCFGDCFPISPLASFLKDIVLLVAIAFLIFGQKYIQPIASRTTQWAALAFSLIISLGLQWYVLSYLPVTDCLPFKKGNNITEQMQIPANAVPDSFAIQFVYEREKKRYEFSPEQLPADLGNYTFIERKDKLIRKGNAEPPIKGFSLTGITNVDSTTIVLSEPYTVLFFYDCREGIQEKDKNLFINFYNEAYHKNKIPVYIVSASPEETANSFHNLSLANARFFKIDFTVFRTAARTNPTIYLLKEGTILGKWSGKEIDKAIQAINNITKR